MRQTFRALLFLLLWNLGGCGGGKPLSVPSASESEGAVVPSILSISESDSYSFGTIQVNSSVTHSFTVSNTSKLVATSMAVTAPNATDVFSLSSQNCSSMGSLNPGASCTVTIQFSPLVALQPYSSVFGVTFVSDGATGVSNKTLTGSGSTLPVGHLSISEANPFNYGNIVTGTLPASHVFQIKNDGTAPASAITASNFAANSNLALASPQPAGSCSNLTPLAAGATCTVTLVVNATALPAGVNQKNISETWTISFNNSSATATLSETITATLIPPTQIGAYSKLSAIQKLGDPAMISIPVTGLLTQFTVNGIPQAPGTAFSLPPIASNSPTYVMNIIASGPGGNAVNTATFTIPTCTLSALTSAVGSTQPLQVTLKGTLTAQGTASSYILPDRSTGSFLTSVNPTNDFQVGIPYVAGPNTVTASVVNQAGDQTSCTGTFSPIINPAVLSVTSSSASFANVVTGPSALATGCLTVTNTGGFLATEFSTDGYTAPFALLASSGACPNPICKTTLAPNEICDLPITFSPRTVGSFSSPINLRYKNGAADAVVQSTISGTSIAATATLSVAIANNTNGASSQNCTSLTDAAGTRYKVGCNSNGGTTVNITMPINPDPTFCNPIGIEFYRGPTVTNILQSTHTAGFNLSYLNPTKSGNVVTVIMHDNGTASQGVDHKITITFPNAFFKIENTSMTCP